MSFTSLEDARRGQGGLKEYLLCRNCEDKRCQWEGYAHHFLFSGRAPQMVHIEKTLYKIHNINYKKLKLFILSTLWLLSVAKTIKEEIDLGPHEAIIRKMLLNEDPGSSVTYAILLQKLDFEHAKKILVYDPSVLHGIYNVYYMMLGGFLWTVFVDNRPLESVLKNAVLQEDGTAYVLIKTTSEYDFFKNVVKLIPDDI